MSSNFNDVKEFQRKFGFLSNDQPSHLTTRKLVERVLFMKEELDEFIEACGLNTDLTPAESDRCIQQLDLQADALVDLVYVAMGTADSMGLPWEDLWNDVHRANMAKVRGIGKRGNKCDCIKPLGWEGPKTLQILTKHGYDLNLRCVEHDDGMEDK